MIFSNEQPLVRKNKSLDDYSVSTWESVKASGAQSWKYTPIDSAWRMQELTRANMGKGEVQYEKYQYNIGRKVSVVQQESKLSRDDAEAQIKALSLPLTVPEEGYTQTALDIVISRKKSELQRKAQIDGTSGFAAGTAKFSAAIAMQLFDPTNVALAFVPVVAPVKYAAMIKSATSATGRLAVRSRVGAAGGLFGAVVAEPIIYMAAQKEQADYTMAESLLNVGLGSVFGAGLHAGAGAVGDAIKKGKSIDVATESVEPVGITPNRVANASPETRDAMFKTSISQEARGVHSDVEAVAATDLRLNTTDASDMYFHGTTGDFTEYRASKQSGGLIFFTSDKEIASGYSTLDSAGYTTMGPLEDIVNLGIVASEHKANFSSNVLVKATDEELTDILYHTDVYEASKILSDFESLKLSKSEAISRYNDIRANLTAGGNVRMVKLDFKNPYGSKENPIPWKDAEKLGAEKIKEMGYDSVYVKEQGSVAVAVFDNKQISNYMESPPISANPAQSLEAAIRNERMRGDDPVASIKAQEKIESDELDIEEELQLLSEQTANLEIMTGSKVDSMIEYDNAIKKAESDALALEAAVTCRMTKP